MRDSGLLIHCVGDHGAFWKVWMRSLECQIQESDREVKIRPINEFPDFLKEATTKPKQ